MEYEYKTYKIPGAIRTPEIKRALNRSMKKHSGFGEAVQKKEGTTVCDVCYRPIKECICGI